MAHFSFGALAIILSGYSAAVFAQATPLSVVHTTAQLQQVAPTANSSIAKDGYYTQGDMPLITYIGSTNSCSISGGDGGYQIPANAGGCWTALAPSTGWPLQIWGPHADGVTDDTPIISDALAQCGTGNVGRIILGPHAYLVSSANLSIPTGCVISAPYWPGFENSISGYGALRYAIILDPAYTIQSAGNPSNQGLENLLIMSKTQYSAGPPATYRAALTDIANYSGTALTIRGHDFLLSNVTFLGFGTCVNVIANERPVFDHVYGDCTNGFLVGTIGDVAHWRDVHLWPSLLRYGNSIPNTNNQQFAVSSVTTTNGTYCLVVASNPNLMPATNDTVFVSGIGGAVGANGQFT